MVLASVDQQALKREIEFTFVDERAVSVEREIKKVTCLAEVAGSIDQDAVLKLVIPAGFATQYQPQPFLNDLHFPSDVVNFTIKPALNQTGVFALTQDEKQRATFKFQGEILQYVKSRFTSKTVRYSVQTTSSGGLHVEVE